MNTSSVPFDESGEFVLAFKHSDEKGILEFFDKYGFVVISDALTEEEADKTLSELFDCCERNKKFNRWKISTWNNWPSNSIEVYGNISRPPLFSKQILMNRQNPRIYKVFSLLLGTDQILHNHDRAGLMRPTKNVDMGRGVTKDMPHWKTKTNLHLDMNPTNYLGDPALTRSKLAKLDYSLTNQFIIENNLPHESFCGGRSLQGVLNLNDNRQQDGGFICVPGFHKEFKDYFTSKQEVEPAAVSVNFFPKQNIYKRFVRIPVRKGSMIVWDQRTPHGSQCNASSNFRAAMFVKMFPKCQLPEKTRNLRRMAVKKMINKCQGFEITEVGRMVFDL